MNIISFELYANQRKQNLDGRILNAENDNSDPNQSQTLRQIVVFRDTTGAYIQQSVNVYGELEIVTVYPYRPNLPASW